MRIPSLAMVLSLVSGAAAAQEAAPPQRPSLEALERIIVSRAPETRIENPDHDRISARRVDIVDNNGVIRMTLAGEAPAAILDGIAYRRGVDMAGLIIYDEAGSERGGFGVADVEGGSAALALDHPALDAIGWRVSPDGSVRFAINQAPPLLREPGLGDRLVPGVRTATRVSLTVAADGTPAVALADQNDRPRVRMTVTPEGFGAIEFLNAEGEVVRLLAPEAEQDR